MKSEAGLKPSVRAKLDKAVGRHREANLRLEQAHAKLTGVGYSEFRRSAIMGEILTREIELSVARQKLDDVVYAIADS